MAPLARKSRMSGKTLQRGNARPPSDRGPAMNRLLAMLILLLPLRAHGALFCISDAADFYPALQTAASSSADDDIRLVSGAFTGLGPKSVIVNGDLRISGGWGSSCITRSATSLTTLAAGTGDNLDINVRDGNLELDRLRFAVWNRVRLLDSATSAQAPVNDISIHRCSFNAMTVGVVALIGRHDLRVTSSIFSGNGADGLFINSPSAGVGDIDARLRYNTFANNDIGLRINTALNNWTSIRVEDSVMANNTTRDLGLYGQEMTVRHSFRNSIFLSSSASLSAASVNNRSGDPGIDSALRPIEPTSQLINNAFSGMTQAVNDDYDGGPREIGSRGDIGAYESNVNDAATLIVTNTNDSGAGSLRQAILDANTNPAMKRIEFNITGSCPRAINLQTGLPDVVEPVTIDGYTQPGSATNESGSGFDGTVCVFLLGGNAVSRGLELDPDGVDDVVTVQGLGFYGFTQAGIEARGEGRANIRGNLFGTGANVVNQPFGGSAIVVRGAPGTLIGGPDLAARNVIGLAAGEGILLDESDLRRTVHGNLIGVDRSGNSALPNGIGIRVADSEDDLILKNTIAFNTAQGILIDEPGMLRPEANNVKIESNRIGTASTPGLGGNGGNGIRILDGDGHRIVANRIWNNDSDGVVVLAESRRNLIAHNTFLNNALQAIDLSPDGVNPIDLDPGQTGANDRQNFPLVQSARGTNTQGDVGMVLSTANGSYTVQVLLSQDCSGFSEGEYVLATTPTPTPITCATSSTNCSMPFSFQVTAPEGVSLIGKGITAIAWDEEGNTSEVSACRVYEQGALLLRDGFE
jgi:hypothetical protein